MLPLLSPLPGPASEHPSLAAAVGPAVLNGKDSPKHQQPVKNDLSAMPRPSALGSVAGPAGAGVGGVSLSSGLGCWGSQGATMLGPPRLLELVWHGRGVGTGQQVPPESGGPCPGPGAGGILQLWPPTGVMGICQEAAGGPSPVGSHIGRAVEFWRIRGQHGGRGGTWAPNTDNCEFETQLRLILVGASWTRLLTKLPHLEMRILLSGQPRGSAEGLCGNSGHIWQLTGGHH